MSYFTLIIYKNNKISFWESNCNLQYTKYKYNMRSCLRRRSFFWDLSDSLMRMRSSGAHKSYNNRNCLKFKRKLDWQRDPLACIVYNVKEQMHMDEKQERRSDHVSVFYSHRLLQLRHSFSCSNATHGPYLCMNSLQNNIDSSCS